MSKPSKEHPLILVCYIDKYTFRESEIMAQMTESFNTVLADKEANAIAFFVPTDDNERIECINPTLTTDDQSNRINSMIDEISKSFDIGQGGDNNLDDD